MTPSSFKIFLVRVRASTYPFALIALSYEDAVDSLRFLQADLYPGGKLLGVRVGFYIEKEITPYAVYVYNLKVINSTGWGVEYLPREAQELIYWSIQERTDDIDPTGTSNLARASTARNHL